MEKNNAVDFYAQFGGEFKAFATAYMSEPQKISAEAAFMKIGAERNLLIHNNFLSHPVSEEYTEIFSRCEIAMTYPDLLVGLFKKYHELPREGMG